MSFFNSQQEYITDLYRRALRSDAFRLGLLLLLFFGAQQGIAYASVNLIKATSTAAVYAESSTMQLLLNGVASTLIFFLIGVVYCLIRRLSFARLFPFERIGGKALIALCVIGLTFSLMSNWASEAVTEVFSLFGLSNRGGVIVDGSNPPSVLVYYLTVAVLPALAEEFAFRGIVMGSLRKYSDALALLVSSAAFALMHGNFVQLPFTFCCGLAFGFIAIKTNSLLPAILVHFLNNALSVTHDVLVGYHIMSGRVFGILSSALLLALCIASIFLIRRIIREKPDLFRFADSDRFLPFRDKLKITVKTPTMIAFAAIMLLYSGYILISPLL